MSEQLRHEPLTRSQVRDVNSRCKSQREMSDRLPRTTRAIVFSQSAGDKIEILLLRPTTLLQDAVEILPIIRHHWQFVDGLDRRLDQRKRSRREIVEKRIERVLPVTPIGDQVDSA